MKSRCPECLEISQLSIRIIALNESRFKYTFLGMVSFFILVLVNKLYPISDDNIMSAVFMIILFGLIGYCFIMTIVNNIIYTRLSDRYFKLFKYETHSDGCERRDIIRLFL